MNNTKAIVVSAGMVMAAALASGGVLAWSASGSEPSLPAAAVAPAEVVVEYVDVPLDEPAPVMTENAAESEGPPPAPVDNPTTPGTSGEYEEYGEEDDDDD